MRLLLGQIVDYLHQSGLDTSGTSGKKSEMEVAKTETRFYDAFLHFFLESTVLEDDLLFFVDERDKVLVRRRQTGKQVHSFLASQLRNEQLCWHSTFILNAICHGQYLMVISVASPGIPSGLIARRQASFRLFASFQEIGWCSRAPERDSFPSAWPLIYFGCHDEGEAEPPIVVLPGQIFCVELFALLTTSDSASSNGLPSFEGDSGKICLFQGAVPHRLLHKSMDERRDPLGQVLSLFASARRKQQRSYSLDDTNGFATTILMRGPEGKGMSQVAIETVDRERQALACRLQYVNLPWQTILKDLLSQTTPK